MIAYFSQLISPAAPLFKEFNFFVWNIKWGVCHFKFFKGGHYIKVKRYSRMIVLKGACHISLSNLSKVHFFQRNRISSAPPVLLHQPFCMKDEWSPCRLPYFLVTVMCYFPPTILSSISFMFLSFSFRGLKNLVSSLMVVPGPWIL